MCDELSEMGLEVEPRKDFRITENVILNAYSSLKWSNFLAKNVEIEVIGQKAVRGGMDLLKGDINGNLTIYSSVITPSINIDCNVDGKIEISGTVNNIRIAGKAQGVKITDCRAERIVIVNETKEIEITNLENPKGSLEIENAGEVNLYLQNLKLDCLKIFAYKTERLVMENIEVYCLHFPLELISTADVYLRRIIASGKISFFGPDHRITLGAEKINFLHNR